MPVQIPINNYTEILTTFNQANATTINF